MTGRFTIHSMAIDPGPMTHELATFMSRETPAQLKSESVVPFQLVDGRVYHKNLALIFPDITICSSGWVDVVDKTMDIMVQMPVPPKWQAGNTMLSRCRCGTRRSPSPFTARWPSRRLDQKAVADLTRPVHEESGRQRDRRTS